MSGAVLKWIAIVTMAMDHIGFLLFPGQILLRLVGRIAFPLFAFAAAEGARHTSNRKRYLMRLLLWAAISEIPFDLMSSRTWFSLDTQNVCWTLAAGVACCWLWERRNVKNIAIIIALLAASTLLMTDYMFPGMLCILLMYIFNGKGQRIRGSVLGCVVLCAASGPLQLPCLLVPLLLYFYTGQPGRVRYKYLFYAFYPVHMLIIWAIYTFA